MFSAIPRSPLVQLPSTSLSADEYWDFGLVKVWEGMSKRVSKIEGSTLLLYNEYESIEQDQHEQCFLKEQDGTGERRLCSSPLIVIGKDEEHAPTTFISGAIHGNERIGPTVVAHLADFIDLFNNHPYIQYLLSTRRLLLAPFANAHGYSWNHREDFNGIDPNRDFPFDGETDHCMASPTARMIARIYQDFDVDVTVTFHGGMRVLSYGWGNNVYLNDKHKANRTPDAIAYETIASRLQAAAGLASPLLPSDFQTDWGESEAQWFYPKGRISDTVYPLDGGMEDWTYSGGWLCEHQKDCHIHKCAIPLEAKPSSLTYLVETDDLKEPPSDTYGQGLAYRNPERRLHTARNAALALTAFESTGPPILFEILDDDALERIENNGRFIRLVPLGCSRITSFRLYSFPSVSNSETDGAMCLEAMARWKGRQEQGTLLYQWEDGDVIQASKDVTVNYHELHRIECGRLDQLIPVFASDLPILTIELENSAPSCLLPVYKADEDFVFLPTDGGEDVAPLIEPQSSLVEKIRHRGWSYGIDTETHPIFLPQASAVQGRYFGLRKSVMTGDPFLWLFPTMFFILILMYRARNQLAHLCHRARLLVGFIAA